MTAKIFIGVFTYQFGEFINECIESIVNQTLQPNIIVVFDDCSSDSTWAILEAWQNIYPKLIRIFKPPNRIGVPNIGMFMDAKIEELDDTWDFLCFVDGDDRWHPQKLEKEIKVLKKYKADVAYSEVNLIDKENNFIGEWRKRHDVPDCGDLFTSVYGKRIFKNQGSIFRNELVSSRAFKTEGKCDCNLTNYWDWDRKIRFSKSYRIAFSGGPLVDYRRHQGGISNSFGKENLLKAHIQVYEKHQSALTSRTLLDQLFVRISFETQASKIHKSLSMSDLEKYSAFSVHERLANDFCKLPITDQSYLKKLFQEELNELMHNAFIEVLNMTKNSKTINLLATSPFISTGDIAQRINPS